MITKRKNASEENTEYKQAYDAMFRDLQKRTRQVIELHNENERLKKQIKSNKRGGK